MSSSQILYPDAVLDGYQLIRVIGEGGFGQVWLVKALLTGEYKALKAISGRSEGETNREFKGLVAYKEKAPWLNNSGVMPVEHANSLSNGEGFFYIMPLGDGTSPEVSPDQSEWSPMTLSYIMQAHHHFGSWFSSYDIITWMSELVSGASALEQVGLVHRDIKPENILFRNGHAVLSDCSLVGEDKLELTRRGTPGYSAPKYYVESGGSPDIYGLGALLYTMLTGRSPDSANLSARRAFWWPPTGEASLSELEKAEWLRLKNVVLTSLDEERRYATLQEFGNALTNTSDSVVYEVAHPELTTSDYPKPANSKKIRWVWAGAAVFVILIPLFSWWVLHHSAISVTQVPTSLPTNAPIQSYPGISNERLAELHAITDDLDVKIKDYKIAHGMSLDDDPKLDDTLKALNKINPTAADADQQLTEFLQKYPHIDFAEFINPNPELPALTFAELEHSGVRIQQWAHTDIEQTLALAKFADFLRKRGPCLENNIRENSARGLAPIVKITGETDIGRIRTPISQQIETLITKRHQAATRRKANLSGEAAMEEDRKADDFEKRLRDWAGTK